LGNYYDVSVASPKPPNMVTFSRMSNETNGRSANAI
jgi:hypothetical protein